MFANITKTAATFPPLWQATLKCRDFEIVNSFVSKFFDSLAQNQPPMETPPSIQNQPPTLSSPFYNQASHCAPSYYSVFGCQLSSAESSCYRNIVQQTRNDQHVATRDSSVQE